VRNRRATPAPARGAWPWDDGGAALAGAWALGKPEARDALTRAISKPGDYSAYGVRCNLGSDVSVTTADGLPDGFLLRANISRSTANAEFTQPYVGKWGDPSATIAWDSRLTIKAKLVEDGSCPGVPVKLPYLARSSGRSTTSPRSSFGRSPSRRAWWSSRSSKGDR
jgi:hypothetical protein